MTHRLAHPPLSPPPLLRRVLRLQSQHKCCKLGDLSARVGWKHKATVEKLEAQRKIKSAAFYSAKKKAAAKREAAAPK